MPAARQALLGEPLDGDGGDRLPPSPERRAEAVRSFREGVAFGLNESIAFDGDAICENGGREQRL